MTFEPEKTTKQHILDTIKKIEQPFTGHIWKLGCNWEKGSPSFYELLKENKIVIGVEKRKYSVGDLILITEGFNAMSIAKILESPQLVTAIKTFNDPFKELKIPFEDWVNISNVDWYELEEDKRFKYELQAGIREVQNSNVKRKVIDLWNNRNFKTPSSEATNKKDMHAKNIILYGPPGTGKTYNSIDKAVEIALSEKYNQNNHIANKVIFDELRKVGQIEFVTFHQNYSYEDFVVGISPDVTSGSLRFDKREGIFKQLAERARQNWLSATNKKEANVDFNFIFNTFFSKLVEEEVKEVEIPMRSKNYKFIITSIDIDEGRIKFTKQNGGTGHDLLVKNLKAIYEGSLDYGVQGLGVYYNPLVDHLKEFAKTFVSLNSEDKQLKKFVLIIDEINRANISKVFGELITLLEEDKRLGEENELKITLPNGEKEFGVPPNLYIIGTMNTADKSIALIDIALRRRFEFIGYYPEYKQLNDEESTLLKKVNEAVFKEKKSADYLIGHAYFMKGQTIQTVLKNKIIPLLMEYFSGKTEIVSRIFADTNWDVTYNTSNFLWDISRR